MRVDKSLFDLDKIPTDISGQGGKENIFAAFFCGWKRINAPLHDWEYPDLNKTIRIELKKQSGIQWFDSGKYYNLTLEDRNIILLFVMHKKGSIDKIYATTIGEFIDWLTQNHAKNGWTEEVMKVASEFRLSYPTLQFKAQVNIRKMVQQAPNLFDIVYSK
jgi:hypothetical protein